jgi:hypothetical protein
MPPLMTLVRNMFHFKKTINRLFGKYQTLNKDYDAILLQLIEKDEIPQILQTVETTSKKKNDDDVELLISPISSPPSICNKVVVNLCFKTEKLCCFTQL